LQLRAAVDVRLERLHHDSRALLKWEACDAHSDGRQGDGAHPVRFRQLQAVRDAAPNRLGGRLAA
jgi:hypothetical protein